MDVAQRRKKYGKREMHSQIVSFQPVSIKRSCKKRHHYRDAARGSDAIGAVTVDEG